MSSIWTRPGQDFNQQTDWNAIGTYISRIRRTGRQSIQRLKRKTITTTRRRRFNLQRRGNRTRRRRSYVPAYRQEHSSYDHAYWQDYSSRVRVSPGIQQVATHEHRSMGERRFRCKHAIVSLVVAPGLTERENRVRQRAAQRQGLRRERMKYVNEPRSDRVYRERDRSTTMSRATTGFTERESTKYDNGRAHSERKRE